VPTFTYEQFIDQLDTAYTTSCKKDQVFYEYGSKLLQQCFSGNTSAFTNNTYVNSAAVNCVTDVVTFSNTTGGTFTVDLSCVGRASDYWSGNTDGSISPSGLTTSVGIGTNTPDKTFHVKTDENTVAVFESTDPTVAVKISDSTDDTYIVGKNSMLYISDSSGSPSSNAEFAFDYVNGKLGIATTTPNEALTVDGTISATTDVNIGGNFIADGASSNDLDLRNGGITRILLRARGNQTSYIGDSASTANLGIGTTTPNEKLTVVGAISATTDLHIEERTYLGTVDAAGASYTNDEILVRKNDGEVEFLTAEQLATIGGYWSASTTGGHIINSGLTSFIGIGTDSPDTALHIVGVKDFSFKLEDGTQQNNYVLTSDANGKGTWQASAGGGDSYWSGNTDGSISPSGLTTNVGIGTSTPSSLFEVKDYISFQIADTTTLIGYEAGLGWENTSENNTMIGHFAGKGGGPGYGPWVGADDNTGVGYLSMAFLTTGAQNSAIGSVSIGTLTTGSGNTVVGYGAGYSTSRDNKNTVVGTESHYQVYGGGGDTTPGTDAFNVAVGYRSLYYPNRGYKNVALGAQALAGSGVMVAGNQGAVAVGYNALNASQSGDYNIAIGYQAADNITTGDNNISIGKDADPPSATASYQMNIGGIIHGNDEYSESKIANVGIGYNDPKTVLDVHHSGNDLTSMAIDTGGGEVIYFGLNNLEGETPLSPGKLMFLDNDFYWKYADASEVGLGGSQLLALALGTLPSDGLLIRGFFHLHGDEIQGTYDEGLPCYVSETAGSTDFTAPSTACAFVRIIGYAISLVSASPRVIYFTPSNDWIELKC
tara:strand:- start:2348 stop:4825 length:2478 start_codon:yes stop_codon:yes gene_type:complete